MGNTICIVVGIGIGIIIYIAAAIIAKKLSDNSSDPNSSWFISRW